MSHAQQFFFRTAALQVKLCVDVCPVYSARLSKEQMGLIKTGLYKEAGQRQPLQCDVSAS